MVFKLSVRLDGFIVCTNMCVSLIDFIVLMGYFSSLSRSLIVDRFFYICSRMQTGKQYWYNVKTGKGRRG